MEGKLKDSTPELGVTKTIRQLAKEDSPIAREQTQMDLEHKFRQAGLDGDVKTLTSMLKEKKVEINCANPKTNQTVMHAVCTAAKLEAVEFLLTQEDLELNPKDIYGNTPMDFLPTNGVDAAKIRKLLESKLNAEEGIDDPLAKIGKVLPIEKIRGKFESHVFLVHDYKDRRTAAEVKEKLETMGVKVMMSKSMMADHAKIKKQVDSSKVVIILGSKSLIKKLKDPIKFQRSCCVAEMDSFVNDKDCAEIIVAQIDSYANLSAWNDCMQYIPVVEEGVVYDLSNEKMVTENFPSLYKELKVKLTS